ncbi:(2Fe-2S)-binding protein [Nguyenibacter sp. L1]|uniref:(2Fe-2S)-binding protein n=1 Tax=Nguyenibacter sp. L1 TaxID=3049350 RepID=UPI002B48ABDD|nr:(2Fe-2S)-binding protein [Nguyenibacter sp. L1]WRH89134.1 (2Fe-2S)-binding protein [Nguyenibacter sp. L1]
MIISLTVNGDVRDVAAEPHYLLSDVLRDRLDLTATHVGCEQGICGACTVLVDGQPARACLLFAVQMEGHAITTLEGREPSPELRALRAAFHAHHAQQCGFCTPGILMTFAAYLRDHPDCDEAGIRAVLGGNLCRCTGYGPIVRAIMAAAAALREAADV